MPGGARHHRFRERSIFMEVTHQYPDMAVHLTLFHASVISGAPQLLEHHALRWITAAEIPQYNFCPADRPILQQLQEQYGLR